MEERQIYVSHLLADEEIGEILRDREIGVETIEFGIPDSLDRLQESIRQYRHRMEETGIARLSVHGPFLDLNPASYDSMIRKATMERFGAAYEAARALGAEKIVFHSCMNPSIHCVEGWPEQMAAFFLEFMENRKDIPVVIENVLDPYPEPLARVMELTDLENLRLCLDVGHAHCYSRTDVPHWCEALAPWLSHLHIHDNHGEKDEHLGVGQGTVPWESVSRILRENPGLTCTVECNSRADIRQSLEYLLRV